MCVCIMRSVHSTYEQKQVTQMRARWSEWVKVCDKQIACLIRGAASVEFLPNKKGVIS